MLFVADQAEYLVGRGGHVEPDDLGARDHHRADLPVVEAEHVAHHRVLLGLDDAGVQPFFEARSDLFFGDAAARPVMDAEQFQRRVRAHRQQLDEWPADQRKPLHRPRDQPRHRLGVGLADAFGHEFAEDDGHEGDRDHDHRGGADLGRALLDVEALVQPVRERRRERGVADDAVQHADRGDADLHHREELGRVFVQVHRRLRAGLARLDHHLQPRLAARRERHLGHGEQRIQNDQEEQ
jgi:hypothetical protein